MHIHNTHTLTRQKKTVLECTGEHVLYVCVHCRLLCIEVKGAIAIKIKGQNAKSVPSCLVLPIALLHLELSSRDCQPFNWHTLTQHVYFKSIKFMHIQCEQRHQRQGHRE